MSCRESEIVSLQSLGLVDEFGEPVDDSIVDMCIGFAESFLDLECKTCFELPANEDPVVALLVPIVSEECAKSVVAKMSPESRETCVMWLRRYGVVR